MSKMNKLSILSIIVFLLIGISGVAQKEGEPDRDLMYKKGIDTSRHIPLGLKQGEKAPVIKATSIDGKEIDSEKILENKHIVVLFYRGKWCPVCRKHLSAIQDSLEIIKQKGAEVLVIGPEKFEYTQQLDEKYESEFTLIPDTSLELLKAFDVLFYVTDAYQNKVNLFIQEQISNRNNQEEAQLPVPATFIIGKNGKVIWRHFNYDYSVRASATEIYNNLP